MSSTTLTLNRLVQSPDLKCGGPLIVSLPFKSDKEVESYVSLMFISLIQKIVFDQRASHIFIQQWIIKYNLGLLNLWNLWGLLNWLSLLSLSHFSLQLLFLLLIVLINLLFNHLLTFLRVINLWLWLFLFRLLFRQLWLIWNRSNETIFIILVSIYHSCKLPSISLLIPEVFLVLLITSWFIVSIRQIDVITPFVLRVEFKNISWFINWFDWYSSFIHYIFSLDIYKLPSRAFISFIFLGCICAFWHYILVDLPSYLSSGHMCCQYKSKKVV
ncbi:Hypothetical_protein [Hexamita inflata]|uniref:Hypothetical_protein n=1 Tax=Hexamita inflata TaxID=28002 RepID=A0AA86U287_9EUKA|nr:Hypothetical protein HINF_LOCUS23147 [Hexamita inflata]